MYTNVNDRKRCSRYKNYVNLVNTWHILTNKLGLILCTFIYFTSSTVYEKKGEEFFCVKVFVIACVFLLIDVRWVANRRGWKASFRRLNTETNRLRVEDPNRNLPGFRGWELWQWTPHFTEYIFKMQKSQKPAADKLKKRRKSQLK